MSHLRIFRNGEELDRIDTSEWKPREEVIPLRDTTSLGPKPVFFFYLWNDENQIDYSVVDGILRVNGKVVGVDLRKATLQQLEDASLNEIESIIIEEEKSLNELQHLRSLIALNARCGVVEEDMQPISDLKGLRVLDLSDASLGDAGLQQLATLTGLWRLYLPPSIPGNSKITGIRKTDLGNVDFDTAPLSITDNGIKALSPLKELRVLGLLNTAITDDAVDYLLRFKNLRVLYLGNKTPLSAQGINRLKEGLPSSCRIDNESTSYFYLFESLSS